jgi:hypothetical protein
MRAKTRVIYGRTSTLYKTRIMPRALAFVGVSLVVSLVLATGCASQRNVVEKVRVDVYRLKCRKALPVCLAEEGEASCQGNHYVVLRAVNELNMRGAAPNLTEDRSSEAIIQCGPAHGWGALGKPMEGADKLPAAGAAVAPAPAPTSCVPGATQACVGPAGCRGGQACRADGGGFLPCDCGPTPAAAPPVPAAPAP